MDTIETLPEDLVTDAVEAFDRYRYAYEHDLLMQNGWHEERDGRQLACALGVLGGSVTSPADCPAQVMPKWLARLTPNFFDRMPFEDAKTWGLKLYEQLARLKGQVPFTVVYDWQANSVLEFWATSLKKRKFDAETLAAKLAEVERLKALHLKHLAGGAAPKAEWLEALRPIYRQAYAYAYAYAYADADADAYADADADAYADADADAYADPTAKASADETAKQKFERRKAENTKLLADGLIEALARAPAPEA